VLTINLCIEQVRKLQHENQVDHEFSIFWVPRRTLVCDTILEEEGVLGDVSIAEFPMYFLPLEKDLLSLELEDSFGDLYLVSVPLAYASSGYEMLMFDSAKRSDTHFPCG
jgi:hypothetical protein